VKAYPVPTLIFAAVCGYLIYSTVSFAWNVQPKSLVVLVSVLLLGMMIHAATDRPRGA
jgi:hypothetical protein